MVADSLLDQSNTEAAAAKDVSTANISLDSENLNALWQRVRYFLNGKDELGNEVEHVV